MDGGQFLALFLQDLDAHVNALEMDGIVGDLLHIEVDGGRARSFGIGGHFEFFVGGLLELGEKEGW